MAWVTLEEVKHNLHYDDDAHDSRLSLYIKSAEAVIRGYITTIPTTQDEIDRVKIATLLLVGMYDDPENNTSGNQVRPNCLPDWVVSQITSLRKPTAV